MNKKIVFTALILCSLTGVLLFLSLRFERLHQPWLLGLWTLLLPLGLWLRHGLKREQERLQKFMEHPLLRRVLPTHNRHSNRIRSWLWLGILACLVMALARPQGPPALSKTQSSGVDILIAVDVSDSMRARDEYPSRLSAARQVIEGLLQTLTGDRVGLMVFAGDAFPLAPFTNDYTALGSLLTELNYDLVPSRTTNLEEALKTAQNRFQRQNKDDETGQVLILISDGENQLGNYQDELKTLADNGVRIFTVGVGSREGARIPEREAWGTLGYKTWQGQEVITRLDEKTLKNIAASGHGSYLHLHQIQQLPGKLQQARSQLQTRQFSSTGALSFEERYQSWLLLALLLLILEQSLAAWQSWLPSKPTDKPKQTEPKGKYFPKILQKVLRRPLQVGLILLCPLLMSAWHWPWERFWNNQQGEQAYQEKHYDQAQKHFEQGLNTQPNDPILNYNQGNALYRSGKYDQALKSYQKSLEAPDNPSAQSTPPKNDAWYNLGNSYYRQGQKNPQQSQEAWKKAIDAYQKALKIDPKDTQALENLNFVQKQLEKQQQQQKQNQKQQQKQNQKSQQQQQKQQSSSQSGQQKQNQKSQPQQPQKAANSPLDNRFTNQEIDNYLKQLKEEENNNRMRGKFQRVPPKEGQNFLDDWMQDDGNVKNW